MKKFLSIIYGILPILAALFIQGSVYLAVSFAITFMTGVREFTPGIEYDISAIAEVACGIAFFYWYTHMRDHKVSFNLPQVFNKDSIIHIIFLGLGCQLFTSGTMSLVKPLFTKAFENYGDTVETIFSGNLTLVIFFVIFLAPVTEELIFRGVLLKGVSRAIPFWGANILQAIMFGIYHWNIVQGIYAFGIGLFLGYVCYKFKSLLASIMLHMVINASSFLLMFFPDKFYMYIVSAISGSILIALGLMNIIKIKSLPQEPNN